MATLILSAAGQILFGPVGGAIGSVAGQYIDQTILFAPKARQGPRLGELSVQTSSYGSTIPKLFGTMRVAGTVIWATDLAEHRSTSGGGKGRPKTVNYSYSASFAVAISARPVLGIGRIWADGKLLRGAAGDMKSAGIVRLHTGGENQAVDPLIAAAEGIGLAPAYRGTAYAVFEDLQLEDFGNRIPSLTFEVTADAGEVTIGTIAETLGDGAIAAGETPALAGYAAAGDSVRGAIEALAEVVPLSLADNGTSLRLTATGEAPVAVAAAEESGEREVVRRGAGQVPGEVSIAYYEIERDFQAGLQRAVRGDGARGALPLALPAALAAGAAKALAEHRLAALWAGRTTAKLQLGWRRAPVRPGDRLAIEGEAGAWRVTRWTLGPMHVSLELVRAGGAPPDLEASPGRPVSQPDLPHGPTLLRLYDLPLGDGTGGKPWITVLAAGEEPGWRRAALSASFDGGASWQAVGGTAAPAVLGAAIDVLGPAGSALLDREHRVEVALAGDAWLESRDDDALAAGANLAVLGEELIQFGAAEPLGDGHFLLSRLLRGRRGTEWAAALHAVGEDFALVDAAAMVAIEAPALGGEARVLANGIGDDLEGVAAAIAVEGAALRPPGPVHLHAVTTETGDILLSWVRRSRQGWTWADGGDAPLGEEREAYRATFSGPGFARIIESDGPSCAYSAEAQAADGAVRPIQAAVVQSGTFAASRPAFLTID
ncbi:MAG TPA: phage tail protein [Allosphingosinicella sp.]|nr:phage tail protein [Allosphingosinicella sp.]